MTDMTRISTVKSAPWAGAPLLASVVLFAFPLTLDLSASVEASADALHEATIDSASTLGFERSIGPALIAFAIYGLAAWKCARTPHFARIFDRRTIAAPVLVLIAAASALWSEFPLKVALSTIHALGAVLVAAAAAARYGAEPRSGFRHIGLAFGLNTTVNLAALALFPAIAFDWDGRWRGLLGNPNSLGLACMCGAWANTVAASTHRGALRLLHATLAVVSVVALIGSRSATSLVALLVAVGGYGSLSLIGRIYPLRLRRLAVTAFIASCGPFAIVAVGSFGSQLWEQFAHGLGKTADMTGRSYLWQRAVDLIADRPALGWGFDANATVIRLTSLPTAHFHNGYLDLMVRGGIVAIVVLVALLIQALRASRLAGRVNGLDVRAAYAPFLLSAAVYNITEVTFAAPRNVSWILVLFVLYAARQHALASAPSCSCGAAPRGGARGPYVSLSNNSWRATQP